jgi:hypothetical protein
MAEQKKKRWSKHVTETSHVLDLERKSRPSGRKLGRIMLSAGQPRHKFVAHTGHTTGMMFS